MAFLLLKPIRARRAIMSSMSRRPRWPAHSFGLPTMEIHLHRLNRRSARGKPDGGGGSGDGAADPASRPSESRAKAPAKWLRLNLTGGNSLAALAKARLALPIRADREIGAEFSLMRWHGAASAARVARPDPRPEWWR